MNCEQIRAMLPLLADGDPALWAEDRAEMEAHVAGCAACRAELEALRAQVELLRDAGRWARTGASGLRLAGDADTAPRWPVRRARAGRRRLFPIAAAAALILAALLGWKLLGPRPPASGPAGRLVSGLVVSSGQPAGVFSPGEAYVVPTGPAAEVELRGGARVKLSGGSSFRLPEDFATRPAFRLISGTARCSSEAPLELRGTRLAATAAGSFALAAPVSAQPPAAPAPSPKSVAGFLFPTALAAEGDSLPAGPEAFLLENGRAELWVSGRALQLAGREAVVGGDGAEPARGVPERLAAQLAAERDAALAGLLTPRYRAIIAEYTERRAGYVASLARRGTGPEERAELAWRIALLEELITAHANRLKSLAAEEAGRLARAQLVSARIEVLARLLPTPGKR